MRLMAILVVNVIGQTQGYWLGTTPLHPGPVMPQTLKLLVDRLPPAEQRHDTSTVTLDGSRVVTHAFQVGLSVLKVYVVRGDEPLELEHESFGDGSTGTIVKLPATDQQFTLDGTQEAHDLLASAAVSRS